MRRHADIKQLPARRVVVQFEFRGLTGNLRNLRYWWFVLNRADIDVCQKNHGYDVDVIVEADITAFTRVWLGHDGLVRARRDRLVSLSGSTEAIRTFRTVIGLRDTSW